MGGGADASAIRERVETAYRVLSDGDARSSYDTSLASSRSEAAAEPLPEEEIAEPRAAPAEPFEDLEDGGEYDGARLRRARLRRGLDFEEIAAKTKVNTSYLGFIEDERYGDLPPRVYVRGFVMAYATCLGLEPSGVAASYMPP